MQFIEREYIINFYYFFMELQKYGLKTVIFKKEAKTATMVCK